MRSTRIIVVAVFFACACNNAAVKDQDANGKDSVTIAEKEEAILYQEWLPELFHYIGSRDSTFRPAAFRSEIRLSTDTLLKQPQDMEQLRPFLPFILINSDSSYALDYVSSGYVIAHKKNAGRLIPGGPDTELALIDLKKRERTRMLFLGSSGTVLTARWISSTEYVVAIAEEQLDGKLGIEIWKCRLGSAEKEVAVYQGTVVKEINDYAETELNARDSLKTIPAF
jgi:hypothetical protein